MKKLVFYILLFEFIYVSQLFAISFDWKIGDKWIMLKRSEGIYSAVGIKNKNTDYNIKIYNFEVIEKIKYNKEEAWKISIFYGIFSKKFKGYLYIACSDFAMLGRGGKKDKNLKKIIRKYYEPVYCINGLCGIKTLSYPIWRKREKETNKKYIPIFSKNSKEVIITFKTGENSFLKFYWNKKYPWFRKIKTSGEFERLFCSDYALVTKNDELEIPFNKKNISLLIKKYTKIFNEEKPPKLPKFFFNFKRTKETILNKLPQNKIKSIK